jgi:hypothetical protein
MNTEKNTMTQVQAAPKTHPGGVHGACFSAVYQLESGPLFIKKSTYAQCPKVQDKKYNECEGKFHL